MYTFELLLRLPETASSGALDGPLAAEASRLAALLPLNTGIRVLHSLSHHRQEALASDGNDMTKFEGYLEHGLVPGASGVRINRFDAVLEVTLPEGADPEELLAAVTGLADRLKTPIDVAGSAAVLGIDHEMMPGAAPLRLFVCLRRVPRVTHDVFADWWLNTLIEHTSKTPGKVAYRQLHADPDLTARAVKATGVGIDDIDGVALEFYPDLARLSTAVEWASQPGATITSVEIQMIDFDRGGIVAYAANP
jgi:hypothetical protein